MLNYITWGIKPQLLELGDFEIRWYGVLFASAFFFGYQIILKIFKKENVSIELLDKLTLYMFLGTVLGARLGHCLFYEPAYYLSNPLEILMIWHGGLASHGAAVGILSSLYIFSRKNKTSYLWILDRIVIAIALGAFFVRTGNLMNSEIIGKATEVPWAFIFTNIDNVPRHPSQMYEAFSYLMIFGLLYFLYKKGKAAKEGLLFGLFLSLLFTARFLLEFTKEVQVAFEEGLALNMGQLLSIPLVLFGVFMLIRSFRVKAVGVVED